MKSNFGFPAWYAVLKSLAEVCGESVADAPAWQEEFELGKSPEGAFYEEYPEHKPAREQIKVVKFRNYECEVRKSFYEHNQRPALVLLEMGTGEPVLSATANLPDEECGPNQAFIKDYSENSGIFQVLLDAKIVKDTGVRARSGFCEFPLVDVLI